MDIGRKHHLLYQGVIPKQEPATFVCGVSRHVRFNFGQQ